LAPDVTKCIVKMSLAKNLRASGPVFKMGDQIVKDLNLVPVEYNMRRERAEDVTAINKKKMASSVFEYVVKASAEQEEAMGVSMEPRVKARLASEIAQNRIKTDDLGDSMLHALNSLWCSGTGYRQLLPANPNAQDNRSVVLCVLPKQTYWVVIACTWNRLTLEDFGMYASGLSERKEDLSKVSFKSLATIRNIRLNLTPDVLVALLRADGTNEDGEAVYPPVQHVKTIVKQLQGLEILKIDNAQAGKLTTALYKVACSVAWEACPKDHCSKYENKGDRKKRGHVYICTDTASNVKYQVVKSAGKHLNAIQVMYQWAKDNADEVVAKRKLTYSQSQKFDFFCALRRAAAEDRNCLDILLMSERVKRKLGWKYLDEDMMLFADLFLIGINQNRNPVKATAVSYRRGLDGRVVREGDGPRARRVGQESVAHPVEEGAPPVEEVQEDMAD